MTPPWFPPQGALIAAVSGPRIEMLPVRAIQSPTAGGAGTGRRAGEPATGTKDLLTMATTMISASVTISVASRPAGDLIPSPADRHDSTCRWHTEILQIHVEMAPARPRRGQTFPAAGFGRPVGTDGRVHHLLQWLTHRYLLPSLTCSASLYEMPHVDGIRMRHEEGSMRRFLLRGAVVGGLVAGAAAIGAVPSYAGTDSTGPGPDIQCSSGGSVVSCHNWGSGYGTISEVGYTCSDGALGIAWHNVGLSAGGAFTFDFSDGSWTVTCSSRYYTVAFFTY